MRAAYDWIGFDPRGVGVEHAGAELRPRLPARPRPPYEPANRWHRAGLAQNGHGVRRRLRANGARAARPPEDHRQRRRHGSRSARPSARSSSTSTASPTARTSARSTRPRSPNRVRRMVLDANVDPRGSGTRPTSTRTCAFERSCSCSSTGSPATTTSTGWAPRRPTVAATVLRAARALRRPSPHGGLVGLGVDRRLPRRRLRPVPVAALGRGVRRLRAQRRRPALKTPSQPGRPGRRQRLRDVPGDRVHRRPVADATGAAGAATTAAALPQDAPFLTWGNAWFNAPCVFWPAKPGSRSRSTAARRRRSCCSARRSTRRRRSRAASRCAALPEGRRWSPPSAAPPTPQPRRQPVRRRSDRRVPRRRHPAGPPARQPADVGAPRCREPEPALAVAGPQARTAQAGGDQVRQQLRPTVR